MTANFSLCVLTPTTRLCLPHAYHTTRLPHHGSALPHRTVLTPTTLPRLCTTALRISNHMYIFLFIFTIKMQYIFLESRRPYTSWSEISKTELKAARIPPYLRFDSFEFNGRWFPFLRLENSWNASLWAHLILQKKVADKKQLKTKTQIFCRFFCKIFLRKNGVFLSSSFTRYIFAQKTLYVCYA